MTGEGLLALILFVLIAGGLWLLKPKTRPRTRRGNGSGEGPSAFSAQFGTDGRHRDDARGGDFGGDSGDGGVGD
ncbi:hypothetical protein HKCCE3408_15240 [Rhodobacterales bacterium HKCCE3408]|nr:hypothetical protein [Rhodobacterales bacterium HKCCE3408]